MLHEKERIETERYWMSSRVDAANLSHIRKSLSVFISLCLYHPLSIFVNLKTNLLWLRNTGIPSTCCTFRIIGFFTTQRQEWVRLRARACNIHATDEYRDLAGQSEKPRQQEQNNHEKIQKILALSQWLGFQKPSKGVSQSYNLWRFDAVNDDTIVRMSRKPHLRRLALMSFDWVWISKHNWRCCDHGGHFLINAGMTILTVHVN